LNQKQIGGRPQTTQNAKFTIFEFGTIPALVSRARTISGKARNTRGLERWNAEQNPARPTGAIKNLERIPRRTPAASARDNGSHQL
jgi:hypothetical protein